MVFHYDLLLIVLILWITKDPQGWGTIKTHCIQQGISCLQHSKGTGQDLKTISRKNNLQCPEHQGLCRPNKEYKATIR